MGILAKQANWVLTNLNEQSVFECQWNCLNILLIEKQPDVREGTSKANSGIIHTGFDAAPGTKLNQEGLD